MIPQSLLFMSFFYFSHVSTMRHGIIAECFRAHDEKAKDFSI